MLGAGTKISISSKSGLRTFELSTFEILFFYLQKTHPCAERRALRSDVQCATVSCQRHRNVFSIQCHIAQCKHIIRSVGVLAVPSPATDNDVGLIAGAIVAVCVAVLIIVIIVIVVLKKRKYRSTAAFHFHPIASTKAVVFVPHCVRSSVC